MTTLRPRRSALPLDEFILRVFVLVDELVRHLAPGRVRRRGSAPAPTDAEVVTVELVGEFLGLDHDRGIAGHFRRYHAGELPALARVHRTTFARPAANRYAVKKQLHAHLAARLADREPVWLVDSLPVEVCKFGRAKYC